jgi:protein-tyrosine-phosphatase
VARELGLDLSDHRSRPLAAIDPASVDIVFVMEPTQGLRWGLAPFRARSPVLLLGLLAGDPFIPDPFGRDPDTFRRCFATIDSAIDRFFERGPSDATRVTGRHRSAG